MTASLPGWRWAQRVTGFRPLRPALQPMPTTSSAVAVAAHAQLVDEQGAEARGEEAGGGHAAQVVDVVELLAGVFEAALQRLGGQTDAFGAVLEQQLALILIDGVPVRVHRWEDEVAAIDVAVLENRNHARVRDLEPSEQIVLRVCIRRVRRPNSDNPRCSRPIQHDRVPLPTLLIACLRRYAPERASPESIRCGRRACLQGFVQTRNDIGCTISSNRPYGPPLPRQPDDDV